VSWFPRFLLEDLRSVVTSRWRGPVIAISIAIPLATTPAQASCSPIVLSIPSLTAAAIIGLLYALHTLDERNEGRLELLQASTRLGALGLAIARAIQVIAISLAASAVASAAMSLRTGVSVLEMAAPSLLASLVSLPMYVLGLVVPREMKRVYPGITAGVMVMCIRLVTLSMSTALASLTALSIASVCVAVLVLLSLALSRRVLERVIL